MSVVREKRQNRRLRKVIEVFDTGYFKTERIKKMRSQIPCGLLKWCGLSKEDLFFSHRKLKLHGLRGRGILNINIVKLTTMRAEIRRSGNHRTLKVAIHPRPERPR